MSASSAEWQAKQKRIYAEYRRRYPLIFDGWEQEANGSDRTSARLLSLGKSRPSRSSGPAPTPWATEDDRRPAIRALRREFIPRPEGLHKASYRRLLREHDRVLQDLDRLPYRRTWAVVRKRIDTQLFNRLYQIRRALGLRVPRPESRKWYRTAAAAALIGVSAKTLLRWTDHGRIACERSPWGHHQRRYRHADLVAVIKELSV
jgi:hypothetical protein